jgi:hypothetical protein
MLLMERVIAGFILHQCPCAVEGIIYITIQFRVNSFIKIAERKSTNEEANTRIGIMPAISS